MSDFELISGKYEIQKSIKDLLIMTGYLVFVLPNITAINNSDQ